MDKLDAHTHKHRAGVASRARHSETGGGSMWKRARYGGLAVGLSMSVSICLFLVTLRGFAMVEASSRSFSSSRPAAGYTKDRFHELREEVRSMFHHGWDNYMLHAFPADEIKPITCTQSRRTRPPEPLNLGLNDVLGNYSLTAIDTLSTLAIFAESSPADKMRFWRAAEELRVRFYPEEEYPDGSTKEMEQRRKHIRRWKKSGIGFDIDSRVQVFEATIRVLGGLLSAHLYATGEFGGVVLPVPKTLELTAEERKSGIWKWFGKSGSFVRTNGGFSYDGWLLDLAYDLGERLLPALEMSKSGLPYPRVNLRWGLQHGPKPNVKGYKYSYIREGKSHNADYSTGRGDFDGGPEVPPTEELPDTITITCPAGAGSLVLEFTTLSRLTGDGRFEEVAKRAFESVWKMRSGIGLIGAELDAEKGEWMQYFSGIGAGIDSFFEYALKAYILLSPVPSSSPTSDAALSDSAKESTESQELFSPEWFLDVWTQSNNAISRHSLRDHPSPHYLNVHMTTGAAVLSWIDSVSTFFPGLLTLSGHVNLAKHTHLVPTALWSRYHSLPERWNVRTGHVESGLKWWPGRPEFIESNYFLYTATGDQWYLKVGEMVLEDIRERCKGVCGWAGLEDVEGAGGEGELADRMESFFLGETFQYLYLLFDREGKLERNESAWVYSTEGHPLIIPKWTYDQNPRRRTLSKSEPSSPPSSSSPYKPKFCENPRFRPDTTESISTHPNFFHAFHFTHAYPPPPSLYPSSSLTVDPHLPPAISTFSLSEPTCAPIPDPYKYAFDLLFPSPDNSLSSSSSGNKFQSPQRNYQRIPDGNGLFIHDLANLRLSFVAEEAGAGISEVRISKVNNVGLGRDEKVFFPESLLAGFGKDDNFGVREAGGGKVDIAIEWQEENEGSAGDVVVDEVASDIGEDENDYEEEERELVKIYKKLEEEVEQLMGGLEGDKKLLGQLVAAKEEGGFWAKSANGLVEQVKGLQREIAQFFDSSAPGPGAPSRLQQKNKRQHQHILTTGTKKDHTPPRRRITIYPALLATGPGAEPLPPPPISSSRQTSKPTWPPPAPPIHYAKIYIPPHHSESKSSPSYACPNLDTSSTDKNLHSLIPADTEVLMLHRGWCKFADKIKSLPVDDSLPSLKLVILVDFDSTSPKELVASASGANTGLTRPYIDEPQGWEISPDGQSWEGMKRKRKVGVLMVRGEGLWEGLLKRGAKGVSVLRKWEVVVGPGNPKIAGGVGAPGGTRVGNAQVVRG